jgi:serine-type D-Ala-D-Ala carboxypeptidase
MSLRVGTPEEAGMSAERLRHVAQLARGWVERGEALRALVALVARHGVIVLHEASGTLGPEPESPPVNLDSIFDLQSLSKTITATAIMALVEDGLLGLNRPVQEYIPEFVGEGKSAVTVFHLLTHTSGLREEEIEAYVAAAFGAEGSPPPDLFKDEISFQEYLSQRYAAPLWKAPGKEMSYLGYGYDLLGEIVERVSGQSLEDFARERIFQPLGMTDTAYVVTSEIRPRLVRLSPEDLPPDGVGYSSYLTTPMGSGTVRSTALDMARFGQMFLEHGGKGDAQVLGPAAVAQMTRNQIPGVSSNFLLLHEVFPEASWGLGWSVEGDKRYALAGSLRSSATFSHAGWGGIWMWIDPVFDLVGVFFSSLRHPHAEPGPRWSADLFLNAVTAAVEDV